MRDELMQSITTLRSHGNQMAETSKEFANDPLSMPKRNHMVAASRELLNCVGRILALADLIDVNLLLRAVQVVQQDLGNLKNSSNQDELTHHFKNYGRDIIELTNHAGKRQINIWDTKLRDELASARATLKKHSIKLFTAGKVFIFIFLNSTSLQKKIQIYSCRMRPNVSLFEGHCYSWVWTWVDRSQPN